MYQHVLCQNEAELLLVWEEYHAWDAVVKGDKPQLVGVFGFKMGCDVDSLVFQKRKGMTLIHHLRGDDRAYLRIEVCPKICLLLTCKGGNMYVLHTH